MQNITKFLSILVVGMSAFTFPLSAHAEDVSRLEYALNVLEKRVSLLENDQTVYGPITVSHILLNKSKHFAVVKPGQTIDCSFDYQLDASHEEFLKKSHLIVGLKGIAAEDCATHLYGVWNSSGTADFKLTAPLEEGDYEVRIAYRAGSTCEEALNSWTVLGNEPGKFATIGILRVCR